MDTKSKKWKAVVSFLAFMLGISLLFAAITTACSMQYNLGDAFAGDYQDTAIFRHYVSDYLGQFLGMATDGKSGYDFSNEYQAVHEGMQADKNVLYIVTYDGAVKYTNADPLTLNGPAGRLPDGYNFLLYFDGEKVSIVKDGKTLDFYGDGYYREGDDWYLPGYQNFATDKESAKATVTMAVAKTPMIYVSDFSNTWRHNENPIYWLYTGLQSARNGYFSAATFVLLSLILLSLYWIWRKDKRCADQFLARLTGHVWFEIKLLVVILSVYSCLASMPYTEFSFELGREMMWDWDMVSYYLQELAADAIWLLAVFWIVYLFINDLRYNRKSWRHSFVARLAAPFQAKLLQLPLQKRMVRRCQLVFVTELLLAAITVCSLIVFWMDFYDTEAVPVMLILVGLIVLLLWTQYRFARQNRAAADDIGMLVNQINAVRNGNLDESLPVPADSDLAVAALGLNNIQAGLHTALEEQMKSERMKVELLANVSHDIKTPLTSIISYVELLNQEPDLPDHVRDYIRILDNKAQRLKTMVQDVFEVSKAASGQLPVKNELLDLGKLLRQTLADMQQRIASSTVTVKADIPDEAVMICADGQRLYRVFQNLLQNALQYSLDGSRVYVSLQADGATAVASVKNTSKHEISNQIDYTERFVRGDQSRTDGGSGLGLSISQTFTEACGGKFQIETNADLFVATVSFSKI